MKTLSPDTSPEAERVHIELLRKASFQKRLQMTNSLTQTARRLSWQGIRERYAHETKEEQIVRFLDVSYGDKALAERVAKLIIQKNIQVKI